MKEPHFMDDVRSSSESTGLPKGLYDVPLQPSVGGARKPDSLRTLRTFTFETSSCLRRCDS